MGTYTLLANMVVVIPAQILGYSLGRPSDLEAFSGEMKRNGWEITTVLRSKHEAPVDRVSIDGVVRFRDCRVRQSFVVLAPTSHTLITAKSNTAGFYFKYPGVHHRCQLTDKNKVESLDLCIEPVGVKKTDRGHSTQLLEAKLDERTQCYVVPAQKRIEIVLQGKVVATYYSRDDVLLVTYRKTVPPK